MGDFNLISLAEEKGGNLPDPGYLFLLNNFIFDGALIDLSFNGNIFTWSNLQHGPTNILQCLNCALVNSGWLSLFPNALVLHDLINGSDHCPIIIHITCKRPRQNLSYFEESG